MATLQRLSLLLLLLPLSLRLLGTYAVLSGPWSLVAGVVGPALGLVAMGVALWLMRLDAKRRWAFIALACLNLGLAVEDFRLGLFTPKQGMPVITWNVALGYSEGADRHRCVQRVLGQHEPKIIALQEIRHDGLEGIARALDMHCTWAGYFPTPGSNGLGLCVPKDWGIHLAQQRRFSAKTQYAYLFAELRPPNQQPFNMMNVHLQSPELSRQQTAKDSTTPSIFAHTTARQIWQFFEVMRVAQSLDDPLLIAGDFNSTPNTWVHGQMRQAFVDAHRHAGRGLGLTRLIGGWLPVRIDYLYASATLAWLGVTRSLSNDGCSDHLPVLGWLGVPKTKP